jgi:hypothetical protein
VRVLRVMMLMYLVSLAATLVAGCGSSSGLPAIAEPSPTATSLTIGKVVDEKWGFEMAYPNGWVQTHYENPQLGGPEGTLQYMVAYADPKGSQGNGSYLDSLQVAVYRVDSVLQPDALTPQLAARLAAGVILKDVEGFSPRTLKKLDVHGVSGCLVGYQFDVGGKTVNADSILIVKGRRAYWMTAQSGAYTWRTVSPTLATCQNLFRLLSP